MLSFFAQLSGKGKPAAAPSASRDNLATIQQGSENDMRRQLVQVLVRDLLRRHGIPTEWIDCQMMIVSSRTRGSGMYIRLVVQHWDERLMNYASAFQKELLADIKQFEPQATNWLHGISWQLEVDGSCPYTTLPGISFWQGPQAEATPTMAVTPDTAPQPAPALKTEQTGPQAAQQAEPVNTDELERLFAIRDRELSEQADLGLVDAGYEKTQPAPL